MFLQSLCDAENLTTLVELDLTDNAAWFEGRGEEPLDKLVTILSRQPALSLLDLRECGLDEQQKQQINDCLAGREPAWTEGAGYSEEGIWKAR